MSKVIRRKNQSIIVIKIIVRKIVTFLANFLCKDLFMINIIQFIETRCLYNKFYIKIP